MTDYNMTVANGEPVEVEAPHVKEEIVADTTHLIQEAKPKVVNTTIDPNTGQAHSDYKELEVEDVTLEEKISNTINSIDITAGMNEAVTVEEFTESLIEDDSMLKELTKGMDLTPDDIKAILAVTNKVLKKEKVDPYKELPDTVKNMIDTHVTNEYKTLPIAQRSMIRRSVSNSIINNFINNIRTQRAKYDFAHQLASICKETTKDIEDTSLELHNERNKLYREAVESITDPDKKQRMTAILDQIDEAKNLITLKEFAKKCKIKSIELEKPKRVFDDFLNKYRNSSNNIYDINIALKALNRNLGDNYTGDMTTAFFVAFCKQVKSFDESNPLDHAYMYYVLYYAVLTDAEDSKEFLTNVAEVIDNIVERNPERFK